MSSNGIGCSRMVLTESLQILGAFKDGLVIVGGWVPEIIFPGKGHMGSIDVDYAVDRRKILPHVYDTIKRRLLEAGYRTSDAANIFYRDINQTPVKIDLITSVSDSPSAPIQGMMISPLKGIELALDHFVEVQIAGEMPDGAQNTVTANVAKIEALILMKAIALSERLKEKDAYDIYFSLQHVPGGPRQLAQGIRDMPERPVIREALQVLANKFSDERQIGPQWAGKVVAENGGDGALAVTDAHQRMALFLQQLGISG